MNERAPASRTAVGRGGPLSVAAAARVAADVLGGPVAVEMLKDKPGRRRTFRANAAGRSVIVKCYASDRAATVATRVAALAAGPPEPLVPSVLHLDVDRRLVVLSDVPGTPLRMAVVDGDLAACRAAGSALAAWHGAWTGRHPPALRPHAIEDELAILRGRGVPNVDAGLRRPWSYPTVVHRDLYEDQILTGPVVGLIDLDDAHLGPPELDIGNLLAHLALLGDVAGSAAAVAADAVLAGYATAGGFLDAERLAQCERLSAIRLDRIHRYVSAVPAPPAATADSGAPPAANHCKT